MADVAVAPANTQPSPPKPPYRGGRPRADIWIHNEVTLHPTMVKATYQRAIELVCPRNLGNKLMVVALPLLSFQLSVPRGDVNTTLLLDSHDLRQCLPMPWMRSVTFADTPRIPPRYTKD